MNYLSTTFRTTGYLAAGLTILTGYVLIAFYIMVRGAVTHPVQAYQRLTRHDGELAPVAQGSFAASS